ncbi:MAG TPA: hypothetical protein VFK69_00005, partial [Candidatus Eisenbacteria bacterium]|nr:hypothetical protein [Candidatus Eisenbacteria bacterium]
IAPEPAVASAVTTVTATATLPDPPAALAAAPAALAAARDDAPAHDSEIERCWRAALDAINGRKRMLGAFLEESRFLGLRGDRAVIAMDALHRAVIEEKDNRALLEEELARAFGRRLSLAAASGAADGSPAPARRPPTAEDVRPMIERAMAWFDAESVDPRARAQKPQGRERTEG